MVNMKILARAIVRIEALMDEVQKMRRMKYIKASFRVSEEKK